MWRGELINNRTHECPHAGLWFTGGYGLTVMEKYMCSRRSMIHKEKETKKEQVGNFNQIENVEKILQIGKEKVGGGGRERERRRKSGEGL